MYKKKLLLILLFMTSCFIFGDERIEITGNQAKAIYVAISDFLERDSNLEEYYVYITEDENSYKVHFFYYKSLEHHLYGSLAFKNSTTYFISKKDYKIINKIFAR